MQKITFSITLIFLTLLSWQGNAQTPDCPTLDAPLNGATDHTKNVTLTWTPAATGSTATAYDIYWGTTTGALTNIGQVTGTTANITNVDFAQTYFWRIDPVNTNGTTDCSATEYSFTVQAAPSAPAGFTCTAGNPGSIYTEEMDAQGAWTGDFGTTNGKWKFSTSTTPSPDTGPSGPSSGTGYMFYEASSDVTDTASAVSPNFDLTSTGSESAELTFNLHAFGSGIGTLVIGAATTSVGPFTPLYTWNGAAHDASTDAFTPVGIDVSSYLGGNLYIEFSHTGAGNWHGDLAIDYVQIISCTAAVPSCDSTLISTVDTAVSGDISWSGSTGATGYKLQVGTTTGGSDVLVETDIANVTSYNLGTLTEATMYYVTITPYNGNGDATGCTEQTFTTGTLPDCVTLDSPVDMAIDNTKDVTLMWTPATTGVVATSYDVYLGTTSGALNLIGNTADSYTNVTNIALGQTYYWRINPVNSGGTTDCSATEYSFTVHSAPEAPTCSGSVQTVFTEEMDSQGSWTGNFATANGNWHFASTTTPSGGATFLTGPSAPFSGTGYMFYEASGNVTDTASAISPNFDLTGVTAAAAEVSFNLHAYGLDTGTLIVGASTSSTGPFTPIFTWEGSAHNGQAEVFLPVGIDVSSYIGGSLYIEFLHTGAAGWQGDLAIDLVEIKTCDATAAGIESNTIIEDLHVYPNPVDNVLQFNANDTIDSINIYTLLGQQVMNFRPNISKTEVDMSNLSAGLYVVKVQIGNQFGTYRVVKK